MRNLLLFFLLFSMPIFGQVVQYGRVVVSDDRGTPLSGVSLAVPSEHDCQPTMSDGNGRFRLCFAKHHVGDVVEGIEVKKPGYEVVNVHVVRNWTLTNADTLDIFMVDISMVRTARMRYYGLSGLYSNSGYEGIDGQLFEVESPVYSFNISRYNKGIIPADVDLDIPMTDVVNDKTFAVIIANEDYQKEQDVPFAIHDGEVFKEYCMTLWGIPEENIHLVTNATLNDMRYEVDWLEATIEAYNGEARGIFYYSGHGIPDEMSRSAFLLPVDGYGSNMESSFGLDALYAQLGLADSELMMYFFDACFSGATREGNMLAESRGVAVNSTNGKLCGNALAFSAALGYETANAYKEKSHGLFTYYLLKILKESAGEVTAGELADYLNENVARMSVFEGFKAQHPSAEGVMNEWRNIKLK